MGLFHMFNYDPAIVASQSSIILMHRPLLQAFHVSIRHLSYEGFVNFSMPI